MSEVLTQIKDSLTQSSEALQDLRGKYDNALSKINAANAEALSALENAKNTHLGELEASKNALGEKTQALENKMALLESRFITDNNQIKIKVGNNQAAGEIASLKEAYNLAMRYHPSLNDDKLYNVKNRVVIEIQEGWEFNESISFYNIDLSHIILTQKNYEVPIMTSFEKEHLHQDNGLLVKIYLENAKITIKDLHLKAKAKELTQNNCWFNAFLYTRLMSEVNIYNIKCDSSALTTSNCGSAGAYPIFIDDNSKICARKIECIQSEAVNEGFFIAENSQGYIETFESSGGRVNYQGFGVSNSSSLMAGTITINASCGANGFTAGACASVVTINLNINAACGHNGVRLDTLSVWYNGQNLTYGTGFTPGWGYKISLSGGGYAVIRNNNSHNAGNGQLCNVANNTWSEHGELKIW